MLSLDDDFQPGPHDVICGRGKKCYTHVGNIRFRNKVAMRLSEYTSFRTKDEKSHVVTMVVNEIRRESPYGGFVKQNSAGVWHEVGDFLAREKTSQAFRDSLSDRYKSSSVSRRKKRQADRINSDPNKAKSNLTTDDDTGRLPDDSMAFANAPLAGPASKSVDTANAPNNSPIPAVMEKRASALLTTPRLRRRSSISITQELFSGDMIDFGMDTFWDEADHREHHSLPDAPLSSDLDDVVLEYSRALSVPEAPPSGARRGSTDSIGLVLAFMSKAEKANRQGGDDEDMSSVSEWDLEPFEFSSV